MINNSIERQINKIYMEVYKKVFTSGDLYKLSQNIFLLYQT